MSTTATYPPRIIEFARRLYTDGERSIDEVREALRKRGYEPKRDTIRYWVDDEYREEKLHRQRRYNPPGPAPKRAWRKRLERMRQLRELRIAYRSIAALMSHDFGIDISEFQVRQILKGEASTSTIKRLLWPEGVQS